jgi:hypothetical protein
MRDRGITRPGLKAAMAAALAVGGAAAIIWSSLGAPMPEGQVAATNVARNVGIVTLVVGSLMTLNYLYALALVRRMLRGENVIASWTVAPATFERFRDAVTISTSAMG